MNALFQAVKVSIIERQVLQNDGLFDQYVLAAIEAYDSESSQKSKGIEFIKALSPLWSMYRKGDYVSIFNEFINFESQLESVTKDHSSHVSHVIQEFLFGYSILLNSDYVLGKYRFNDGKLDEYSEFNQLLFSWMAASLFHDIGYDIEKSPDEEEFRNKKNCFWDFITERPVATSPLEIPIDGIASKIIQSTIIPDINRILNTKKITLSDFNRLFIRKHNNHKTYDHGVISAIKYIAELEKLENKNHGNYLNWQPNKNAALAMAVHNFRYKDCDLFLEIINENELLPYLLMVSDELQEWERERNDFDIKLDEIDSNGKNLQKNVELIGAIFKEKTAFIIIDHKLKNQQYTKEFISYMDKKVQLQKKHYPIKVFFPFLNKQLSKHLSSLHKEVFYNYLKSRETKQIDLMGVVTSGSSIEIDPDNIGTFTEDMQRRTQLEIIANTKCEKKLLIPQNPPLYRIFVDHRIDGNPYLTIEFPM